VNFIGCDGDYDSSRIVLFGAPYDCTSSFRPGSRFAPAAIRTDSWGLELYSPYQNRALPKALLHDAGDLELPFGGPEPALGLIEDFCMGVLRDGKLPFMLGGEHLVTLGAVRAIVKKYSNLHILHFDAHADLRDKYLGQSLSHATVMRRCFDLTGTGRIFQFGIRSGDESEFLFSQNRTVMRRFDLMGLGAVMSSLRGVPVYVTIDLDVLDPSLFPGTGAPEAGGVSFTELLSALTSVLRLNVVGADVSELSPPYDQSGCSTAVACKIIREMLIALGS
jgi:agmatinase